MEAKFDNLIRKKFKRKTSDGESEVDVAAIILNVDAAFDRVLELGEILGPGISLLVGQASPSSVQELFRTLTAKGGHEWVSRFLQECMVKVGPVMVTTDSFSGAFGGRGGLSLLLKVTVWVMRENFGDFFTEALDMATRAAEEAENAQKEQEES